VSYVAVLSRSLADSNRKSPKVSSRSLLDILFNYTTVLFFVLCLDSKKMLAVPMQSHKTGDEQLNSLLAFMLAGSCFAR
jgi:hypothetical protein